MRYTRRRKPASLAVDATQGYHRMIGEKTPEVEAVGPELTEGEGEGDSSRDYWATVHRRYFEKRCAQWGVEWREDLDVVCEYFDLAWTGA